MRTSSRTNAARRSGAYRTLLALALPGLLGLSCGSDPPAATELAPVAEHSLIYQHDGGGIRDLRRTVVRDRAGLARAWSEATSHQGANAPSMPAVDFEQEMVVVVAAGPRKIGSRISVERVGIRSLPDEEGDMRDVMLVCVVTTASAADIETEVYPVSIVRVTRFDGPVQWQDAPDPAACR
ncbi:MAG: hypothetical protein R3195_00360 [Gemmatimonadota bacterium]|nr:hypothetical protein [Gemmatimonadota bacterium]